VTQATGHGVKQRDVIRMTPEEVDDFLAGRNSMSMCTLRADGSIHAVGMWYGFLEGAVAVETKAKSQKVTNLRRDPRMTCLVETGEYYEELRGVELVGRAELVVEPDRVLELGKSVFDRYVAPYSEAMLPAVELMLNKRVVIKLHLDRVTSWDHGKLGLPSTRPPAA